jgi:GMP synthase PP-ATPase subunit
VSHIASKFDGFVHDKPFYADLQGGCCATKRRIDLRKLINNTMLCIEIDEDQHKGYIRQNERDRYDDLFMDFTGKYIFIRYNPDKFIDKYQQSKNPFFETRMEVLEAAISKHTSRIERGENEELLEIHHLFYDEC